MNRLIRCGLRSRNSLDSYRGWRGWGALQEVELDKLLADTAPATLGTLRGSVEGSARLSRHAIPDATAQRI